jgi:hypothetical protein
MELLPPPADPERSRSPLRAAAFGRRPRRLAATSAIGLSRRDVTGPGAVDTEVSMFGSTRPMTT